MEEINLNMTSFKVEAKSRELRDYNTGMTDKEKKEILGDIRSELKFFGFTMSVETDDPDDPFGESVMIHNIKEDVTIGIYISDFIYLELDSAIDFIKSIANQKTITEIGEEENLTEEEIGELEKAMQDEIDEARKNEL